MAIQVTISNVAYNIMEGSLTTDDTADGRSVAQFDVKDLTGALDFQQFQTVSIVDTTNNYLFTGEINDSIKKPLAGTPAIIHTVSCVDGHTIPDKRYYAGPEYQNKYAGDIATDLLRILGPEGITAAYAVDNDQSIADWQQGTLSNVVAVNNISGGDLELAPSGTALQVVETGSAFSTGTPGNTHVDGKGHLAQNSFNAIKIVATQSITNAGNTYTYVKFFVSNHVITSSDYVAYDVFVAASSPEIKIALDFVCTDGTTWRDHADPVNGNDAQNLPPHPKTDLKGLADGTWYHRAMWIGSLAGKTIQYFTVVCEGDTTGTYTGYFKNIYIATDPNGTTITQHVYNNASTFVIHSGGVFSSPVMQLGSYGYSSTSVTIVPCYNPDDFRTGPSYSLSSIGNIASTMVSWTETSTDTTGRGQHSSGAAADRAQVKPADGSFIEIGYSLDGMQSYTPCINGAPLPNFPAGISLSGKSIQFIQFLVSGLTPEDTPTLNEFQFVANPGYTGTKTDIINIVATSTEWDAGTRSNTGSQGLYSLSLNGSTRNWDNADSTNQTIYGQSGFASYTQNKTFMLASDGGSKDVRSKFDFAGTWQNFTIAMDVYIELGIGYWGFFYRTTNFSNNDGTFAYAVEVGPSAVNLVLGNNSTGTGSKTVIGTAGVSLASASWHRVKAVISGSSHTIYLDDVQMFQVTDGTFTAAGYVGARFFNGAASNHTAQFDNFGIVPALSGTWLSAAINLAGAGAYMDSDIRWTDDSPDFTNVNNICEVTTDGGTTWTQIINNGPIADASTGLPIFTSGQSLSGVTAQFRFTLATTTATVIPSVGVFIMKLLGSFSGSGTRTSEAISLAPVGNAGSTSLSGSGIQPANTAIAVDSSLDGVTWTQIATATPTTPGGTSVTLSGVIAGITTQTDPVIDEFLADSSLNYTSTFATGGSLASYTWDTAHNRLSVSGGNQAVLLCNSPTIGADIDVSAVLDTSDNGGLAWRFVDQNNFYYCSIHDASNGTNPNILQLFKFVGGVRTQIGANVTISFTRGAPHIFRAVMVGTGITVSMDGVTMISTNDSSISAAGFCGVRNNASGGSAANFYALRIQFLGQNVTGMQFYTRVRLTSTDPTATPQLINLTASVHDPSIQSGALIPSTAYSIVNGNKNTLAAILDDLVKQSGNYWWKIVKKTVTDPSYRLLFQKLQSTPAPWVVTGLDTLVSNLEIDNLNDHYRNSEWITGGKDTTLQTYTFVGDERTTVFNLPYAVDSIVSMTINNVPAAYGIKGVDTGDVFYWKQGDFSIVQDASLIPLNDTQTLVITFYGQVDITVNVQNPSEINRVSLLNNTTGIVEQADDGSGLNKAAMIIKGLGYLNQFAQTSKTAKFSTLRSGLAVGQLAPIFNVLNIFAGAFLIVEVKHVWKTTQQNGVAVLQPWYDVTAISGPIVGDWTRFVNNLAS